MTITYKHLGHVAVFACGAAATLLIVWLLQLRTKWLLDIDQLVPVVSVLVSQQGVSANQQVAIEEAVRREIAKQRAK